MNTFVGSGCRRFAKKNPAELLKKQEEDMRIQKQFDEWREAQLLADMERREREALFRQSVEFEQQEFERLIHTSPVGTVISGTETLIRFSRDVKFPDKIAAFFYMRVSPPRFSTQSLTVLSSAKWEAAETSGLKVFLTHLTVQALAAAHPNEARRVMESETRIIERVYTRLPFKVIKASKMAGLAEIDRSSAVSKLHVVPSVKECNENVQATN